MSALDLSNCTSFTMNGKTHYYDRDCKLVHVEDSCPSIYGTAVGLIMSGSGITQSSGNYTLSNGRATFYDREVSEPKDMTITASSVPESGVVKNYEGEVKASNCTLKTITAAKKITLENVKVSFVSSLGDAVIISRGEAESVSAKALATITSAKVKSVTGKKVLLMQSECERLFGEGDAILIDSKATSVSSRGNITLDNSTVTDVFLIVGDGQSEKTLRLNTTSSVEGRVIVRCDYAVALAALRRLGIQDRDVKIEIVLKIKEGTFSGEIIADNCKVKVIYES